jgi:DNA-binding ferritin-like protein
MKKASTAPALNASAIALSASQMAVIANLCLFNSGSVRVDSCVDSTVMAAVKGSTVSALQPSAAQCTNLTKDPKALRDKVMLVVDDKLMDITEEGCVQLLRLQKIDVSAVQPRREGDKSMVGLVGSFRLWISAFQSIMFDDIKDDTEMRVIKDMSRTVADTNAFALAFQQCDSNTADYAYKELHKALQENLSEFCKQLARRSDKAALVGDTPKKSERSGRYKDIPSPPTFRPDEVNNTIARGSLVRQMIKKLPQFQQYAKADNNSETRHKKSTSYSGLRHSQKPCFEWRDTGSCSREACRYTHGAVTATTTPPKAKASD